MKTKGFNVKENAIGGNKIFKKDIYVWFNGKKYMTTNKRWSELVQNTVKKVMPDGYHFNYIQCSQTTESIYFSILNENRLYYFRVSSHHRKKREDNVTTFLSGKYNGFKELSEAIGEYLKSNRFVRISDKHILILLLYLILIVKLS